MKTLINTLILLISLLTSCDNTPNIEIEISNLLDQERNNEIVEIRVDDVTSKLKLSEKESFIIKDSLGHEIPYQITYDKKIIFPASVHAKGVSTYRICQGIPKLYEVKACGKVYSIRMDDLAWENDLTGYRAYGPAMQKKGEKGYGYDLFAKRNTYKPILEQLYSDAFNKAGWEKIKALKKSNPKAAKELANQMSYHVDKGYGMDCYAVGPTLGAGVTALLDNNKIIYPWCYKSCKILDNGPLRFSAKLNFGPINFKGSKIEETRIISLDAGSHMNKTSVFYKGVLNNTPIVSGIVVHDGSDVFVTNKKKGFITYQDPTTGPNQGNLFLAHIFPNNIIDTRVDYFSKEESKERNNAKGHILAESSYSPGSVFTYYWGFGWDRSDIKNFHLWNVYVESFAEKMKTPLHIYFK